MELSAFLDFVSEAIHSIREQLTVITEQFPGHAVCEPLTGIAFIGNQLREMLIMAACGAGISFLFHLYNSYAKKFHPGVLLAADFLFCILAGAVILQFWFFSSYGRLSFHETLGLLCGLAVGIRAFAFGKSKGRHTAALFYVILMTSIYIILS